MELPHVDAVGVVRYPLGYEPSLRPRSWRMRVAAVLMLVVFSAVVISTTVVSIGRYCLTSDGADVQALPTPQFHTGSKATPSTTASPNQKSR